MKNNPECLGWLLRPEWAHLQRRWMKWCSPRSTDHTSLHTSGDVSYLTRCSPRLVTHFWLYLYPKFCFVTTLNFMWMMHTCPSEMTAGFTAEFHRASREAACRSLLELCFSSQRQHFPAQSSQHIFSDLSFGCLHGLVFIFDPSSVMQEVHTCHVHIAWLCPKDLSAPFISAH